MQGFNKYVKDKSILDPFAGNCDLLKWANNGAKDIKGLDIDKKLLKNNVYYNDSLKHIPNCKFVLTNPPYLGKNKLSKKSKKYCSEYEDLYLVAINNIINSNPDEGIIIVPVNFFLPKIQIY